MTDSATVEPLILIIEDDFVARECLAALLRRRRFEVVTAKNASVALALLASPTNPDIIILDMLMPELDGWRSLEELRNSRHRAVPVLVTSGSGLSEEWAQDHGCAGFLRKPFDEADLFDTIGRILNSPGGAMRRAGRRDRQSAP